MGTRYWITGVQLGMFINSKDNVRFVQEIMDNQMIDTHPEPNHNNTQQEKTEIPIDHQSAVHVSSSEEFVDRSEKGSAPAEARKGCGKEICQVPDILVCGERIEFLNKTVYCDECTANHDKVKDGGENNG